MSARLRWRDAAFADRSRLPAFECTEKVKRPFRRKHELRVEREWELEAQGMIRVMRPPAGNRETMLVGEDGDGRIAAVVWAIQVDGPHDVFVRVIGIGLWLRGTHSGVADEALQELIERHMSILAASHSDEQYLVVSGKVDPRNKASREMCERNGAELFDDDDNLDYGDWIIRVPRPA